MTTQEKLTVMQAWMDGREIEYRTRNENSSAFTPLDRNSGEPGWDWGLFEYRISPPPPMEIKVWVSAGGDVIPQPLRDPMDSLRGYTLKTFVEKV